jgi:hypothetical protein
MDGTVCLIVSGIAVVGLSIFALAAYLDHQRTQAIKQIAEKMGLQFKGEGQAGLIASLGHLDLFSKGRSKQARNLIFGDTEEVKLYLFDYYYTTGSGKNSSRHSQTVAYFQAPDMRLPQFTLQPESFLHWVAESLGFQDIDFETHPDFSKKFVLKGPEEQQVRELFRPQLLEYFEQQAPDQLSVQGAGDQLVVFVANQKQSPTGLKSFMDKCFGVYAAIRGE